MNEREIFDAALAVLDPTERAAFLELVCSDDTAQRLRLQELLDVQRRLGSFLESPPVAPTLNQPPLAKPGTQIGPYKLLQQIGEGGFGVVYMAEQTQPVRRKVALKVIKPGMDTRQVIARFGAEQQALAVMDHPNIAKVLDAGEVGPVCRTGLDEPAVDVEQDLARQASSTGRPYFVMELVRGIPITQYCDEKNLPVRQRLELFATICQAIQHAHSKGIIHRDIKPTNVLITQRDGQPIVKVIDFGIAKAMGQRLTQKTYFTEFAQMIGTPLYMSPEQAAMSCVDIDTRSDIYSLGVLLYELLTDSTPVSEKQFKQATFDEIRRIIREDVAPRPSVRIGGSDTLPAIAAHRDVEPGRLQILVRGELDWIVMKCLEKDRNRRYETAASLAADVKRFLNDEPVQACPPSTLYRLQKLVRRRKGALISVSAVALAALLAVVALAVSTGFVWRANQKLLKEVYRGKITVAHRELSTDVAAAVRALHECPEDLRGWEWHYLMRLCKVEPLVLRDTTEMNSVAFSADGKLLVSAGGDGSVKIWNSRTGNLIQTLKDAHNDSVLSVAFHPDGRHVASAGADRLVKVWDLETSQAVFQGPCDAKRKTGSAYTVAFSPPDGRQLAAGCDGVVRLWDWKENRPEAPEHSFRGHNFHSIPVAFSRDGRRLATGGWFGEVQKLWDAEAGGLPLRTFAAHRHPVSALAFSPDGGRLASASFDRTVNVWNTKTGELLLALPHTGTVDCVAFSRDGLRLASAGQDKVLRVWDAATGTEVLGLRGHTGRCGCVAFSPDGWRLASASHDGTIRIWDATPWAEREETPSFSHSNAVNSMAISPNGKRIVAGGYDPQVMVWDAQTGKSVKLGGGMLVVFCVAWHGERIAAANSEGPLHTVKVWDARDGREAISIPPGPEHVALPFFAVAFSPDGRYLVTGNANGAVQVWDAGTGQPIIALGTHSREIRGLVFSSDGRHLASASSDGKVRLWDAKRLNEQQESRLTLQARVPGSGLNVAFSPDGRRLVTGGDGNTVLIWDMEKGGEPLMTLTGHSAEVSTVAFSPDADGQWVASGGEDSAVKIWDSQTGKLVRSFRGHTDVVSSVAFSPDGARLISGSLDHTVKVWELTQLRIRVPEP